MRSADQLVFGRRKGVLLLAPREFFQIDDIEMALLSNGCGPGDIGGKLVPDTAWGEDISAPCDVHDIMYQRCVGKIDEIISDCILAFNLVMVVIMSDASNLAKTFRLLRVFKYIAAVALTIFSDQYWEDNKGAANISRYAEANMFVPGAK